MIRTLICLLTFIIGAGQLAAEPTLLSAKMIWDGSPYSAFTDLIEFQNQFLCTFRESNSHQDGENGVIRILVSPDAETWTSQALLSLDGYDLRDPKLSIMPNGDLLLNMGATIWESDGSEILHSAVSFSSDGINWSPVQVLLPYTGEWIWRVTWNGDTAYGFAYSGYGETAKAQLMKSTDAINWELVKEIHTTKGPTETTARFLPDGTMVALMRRNDGGGIIGTSPAPYTEWKWFNTNSVLGGPDFLILEDGSMLASSRQTEGTDTTTILAHMGLHKYKPFITFPSSGDCSYPGMVVKDGKLYVSYYSSQTGTACIYLAIIQL